MQWRAVENLSPAQQQLHYHQEKNSHSKAGDLCLGHTVLLPVDLQSDSTTTPNFQVPGVTVVTGFVLLAVPAARSVPAVSLSGYRAFWLPGNKHQGPAAK